MQQRLTDDKSIYLQISQMIETDILRGILLEEERVPSTNELAKLYTINPATAAKMSGGGGCTYYTVKFPSCPTRAAFTLA